MSKPNKGKQKREVFGADPLAFSLPARGIFQKPDTESPQPEEIGTSEKRTEPAAPLQSYLESAGPYAKTTVYLPDDLNDWVDSLLKYSRKSSGRKIEKRLIVQAGIEFLKANLPLSAFTDEEELRSELMRLSNILQDLKQ